MRDPARRPATWVLPPLPYALALYASWRLEHEVLSLPVDLGKLSQAAGWGLIVIGLLLFGWTVVTFHNHHTTVNPYAAASSLCTDGPFRFSRNPIYVGDWCIYAGVTLLLKTIWPLGFALPVWLVIRYAVIRHEEVHLEAKFGDTYRDFRVRVRRWL